jgi:hypothetical protein
MSKSVKDNSKLQLHSELRVIGIAEEYGVILKGSHKCVEGEWANSEILSKVIWAPIFECCEDMVEVGRTTGKVVARLFIPMFIHLINFVANPLAEERCRVITVRVGVII